MLLLCFSAQVLGLFLLKTETFTYSPHLLNLLIAKCSLIQLLQVESVFAYCTEWERQPRYVNTYYIDFLPIQFPANACAYFPGTSHPQFLSLSGVLQCWILDCPPSGLRFLLSQLRFSQLLSSAAPHFQFFFMLLVSFCAFSILPDSYLF
jgi:hypothetical protein